MHILEWSRSRSLLYDTSVIKYPSECSKIHKSKLACPHGPCSDSLVPLSLLSGVYIWNVRPIASSCALGSLCPPFLFLFKLSWVGIAALPRMHFGVSHIFK
ncbi:unnamed protein product [Rhizopus microsporus]